MQLHSFKTKLILSGIVISAVPLLVLFGISINNLMDSQRVAANECNKLGINTLDHIAQGVFNSCAAQNEGLKAGEVLDPQTAGSHLLRQGIMDIKIGQTGYVYVLDSNGNYVVSAGGKRDGQNIWEAKDANGVLFIQELITKARKASPGTIVEQLYPWKNPDDDFARMKICRLIYFPQWDWIIGAGAYQDEFLAAEQEIKAAGARNLKVIAVVVALSLLSVGILAWLGGRGATGPLLKAVNMANAVAAGDLSGRLNLNLKDEIGGLANALDEMSDNLQLKVQLAEKVAQGDLTMTVTPHGPKDVFGQALKTMTEHLTETMAGIQEAARQVKSGSREVSSSSTALSQGATEQAASLQEITSSMTELSSVVSTNAQNAGQADQLSSAAKEAAESGVLQMQEMTSAMSEISQSSSEIAKIIKVIDDIAFQTNLLALNAAVEAARAGKHGKGFAVVAEEVRNLAGRSAKAARETTALIEGSQNKVDHGNKIAEITSASLLTIVEGVTKTSDLVSEIAIASNQQSQGIAEVSEGLKQIDSVTQNNTANSEETAAAGQELASMATRLQELVATFQLPEGAVPRSGHASRHQPEKERHRPMTSPDEIIELVGGNWPA